MKCERVGSPGATFTALEEKSDYGSSLSLSGRTEEMLEEVAVLRVHEIEECDARVSFYLFCFFFWSYCSVFFLYD